MSTSIYEGAAGYAPDPAELYLGEGSSFDESTYWLLYYDVRDDVTEVVDIRTWLGDEEVPISDLLQHVRHYPDWSDRMMETVEDHFKQQIKAGEVH